jgi:DNA end-binding protein Ku
MIIAAVLSYACPETPRPAARSRDDHDAITPREVPMATRSFASLTLSFGLVSIPVDVYSGQVAANKLSFNLLHAKDGARVKQQYVCALDGEPVERSEMVKGYEYEKDKYVVFKPEEIKALEEAGSDAIDILEFVPLETVDPVFFDRTYLLAPARHGAKPYALLNEAMRQTRLCAVGRWAARGREFVVVLRPIEGGMAMHQLFFKDEVRSSKELGMAAAPEIAAAELKLAKALIDQRTEKRFDPNRFHDEFRERVDAAIQKKIRSGGEIPRIAAKASSAGASNVVDLMEVLARSLAKNAAGSSSAAVRKPPKRVTSAAAKTRRTSRGG